MHHEKKSKVKKQGAFLIISLIVLVITSYLIYKYKFSQPWRSYKGLSCTFSVCETLEINQKYEYWLDQAVKLRNPSLCNNVKEYMPSDFSLRGEEARGYCQLDYHVQIGDAEYCRRLKTDRKNTCLIKLAEVHKRPELCNELEFYSPAKESADWFIQNCKNAARK